LKLDDTPNFINFPNYVEELSKFLKPYNMTFIKYSTINGKLEFEVFNSPYVLAAGKSPRGDYRHVVVGKINQVDFELVHDPYPDGSGLEGKPLWIGLFISINPNSNLIKS